ncbi:hypothetical protein [Lactiplantibacillus plantarum]|uniref:hypothetical protein n=1 Tax=Lactiplantibacillus plantarum TaxID=1590 RepID=UPI0010C542B6|nr:hypothetical protein [Lactiplantibacillus plantarum]MBA3078770.1 hypothetical protein [Lactiplantibacillus plantarum]MBA3081648.1 hypothetical protein [Lactiplantibacillus plantarum]MBA3084567.1 hypothetical protein [Lactiplantibacillus plantarum]MDT4760104.1 hypothetical protein [Lactiplantibacillus plantarum]MDY7133530.1 hypothetical protein [Lactiplantibacillus plantarum]
MAYRKPIRRPATSPIEPILTKLLIPPFNRAFVESVTIDTLALEKYLSTSDVNVLAASEAKNSEYSEFLLITLIVKKGDVVPAGDKLNL